MIKTKHLWAGFLGGVPSFFSELTITPLTVIFGFTVWILFGLILAATLKFSDRL